MHITVALKIFATVQQLRSFCIIVCVRKEIENFFSYTILMMKLFLHNQVSHISLRQNSEIFHHHAYKAYNKILATFLQDF